MDKNKLKKTIRSASLSFFNISKKNRIIDYKRKNKKYIIQSLSSKSIKMHHLYKSKNFNIFNKKFNEYFKKMPHFLDAHINDKHNQKILKNDINTFYCTSNPIYKKNSFLSKNTNKIENITKLINFSNDKISRSKSNLKSFIFSNLDLNVKWKKVINQQILLSISKKEKQAEMHLKSDFFGSIYIKMKIEKNYVTLNFFSKNQEIKIFLDNCIPLLIDSLIKNGIQLNKINIYDSFCTKKIYSEKHKNNIKSIFLNELLFKKNINSKKQYITLPQDKFIDMYV